MFAVLLGGIYSAYKHFSGLDPFKLDPQAVVSELVGQDITKQINQKVLGKKSQPATIQPSLENLTKQVTKTSKPAFNFLMVADSHSDNGNLKKALVQAKDQDPQFVIGLGDYTDVGTVDELKAAKQEFDSSGIRYFLLPGDHDLWDCRNRSQPPNCNFREVFGPSYQSFIHDNFYFILLYNSDNYLGLGEEQLTWLDRELQKAKDSQARGIYVFVHEPLFHPSSDHVMGRVEKKLKTEAKNLLWTLKNEGVSQIFAGDIHYFTKSLEPETNLTLVTVGALTSQRNAQAPRYAIAEVFEDGSIQVEDVEIR